MESDLGIVIDSFEKYFLRYSFLTSNLDKESAWWKKHFSEKTIIENYRIYVFLSRSFQNNFKFFFRLKFSCSEISFLFKNNSCSFWLFLLLHLHVLAELVWKSPCKYFSSMFFKKSEVSLRVSRFLMIFYSIGGFCFEKLQTEIFFLFLVFWGKSFFSQKLKN